jgi:hypothetical protein
LEGGSGCWLKFDGFGGERLKGKRETKTEKEDEMAD